MSSVIQHAEALIDRASAMRTKARGELEFAAGESVQYLTRCINRLDKAIFAARLAVRTGEQKYLEIAQRAEVDAFGTADFG